VRAVGRAQIAFSTENRMQTRTKPAWLAIAAFVLMAGCASTPGDPKIWRDPNYAGPPFTRIFVVGLSSKGLGDRQGFEDLLVSQIRAAGALAAPGYQYIPPGSQADQATVIAALRRSGGDAMLVVRITGYKNRDDVAMTLDPGFGFGFDTYDGVFAEPLVVQYQVATVYTTLYDAKTMNPVWTYSPKTMDPSMVQQQASAYASTAVALLQSSGLLGARLDGKPTGGY
jgi:hypothetical protein